MSKQKCDYCGQQVTMKYSPHGREYCPQCKKIAEDEQRELEHNQIEHIVKD